LMSFILIVVISTRPWWSKKSTQKTIPNNAITTQLFETAMFILLSYLLLTTTLHPWYITPLLAISIFTHFRFAIVWSAMIFLTYAGYTNNGFEENLWLTTLEYISVMGYLAYELVWKRKYLQHIS
jgi:alpha-1,6-mannosyltransferase